MKKLYLAVVSLLLIYLMHVPGTAVAQNDACHQNVVLTSQAQVDAWPVTHGCSSLIGALTISGDDITHLDSLYSLYDINSDLIIRGNDALVDLDGLETLEYTYSTTIEDNPLLTNVNGLHSLKSPYGGLNVRSNPQLQSLNGLTSLSPEWVRSIDITNNALIQNIDFMSTMTSMNDVVISANPSLTSLEGLRNMTTVYRKLDIIGNESLANLDGLRGLTFVYDYLRVSQNAALTNIDGLSNLTKINGGQEASLIIESNPVLTNLDGLSGLTVVSGSLRSKVIITHNNTLSNVDGLSNLIDIEGGLSSNLTITNNPNLGPCCGLYQAIYNHSWDVGACEADHSCSTITMSGNKPSCTETAVLNECIPDADKCSGDIRLTTQAAIDYFPTSRGCTTITGTLLISGPRITNLDGLSALVQAEDITITGNYSLESYAGLENLTRVKNLTIRQGNAADVQLTSLTTVDENLSISLYDVTQLSGLRNLTTIGKDLSIDLTGVRNLNGLSSLTSVGGNVTLTNNFNLSNVDGLESLATIGGKLEISRNNQLLNLDGLSALDSVGSYNGVSVSITKNRNLEWCCGLGRVLQDHLYSGAVNISENSAGCQQSTIEANGPCCQPGSPLPVDKFVFAEVPKGPAPHSTNIIVRDYEAGIYYELHNDADDAMVAGPQPGDIGLFASNITQTTTFNVMARNPQTGCRATMNTRPVITILTEPEPGECSSLPSLDKQVVAENDTVPSGRATNIIVLNYDEGVEYVLRNDFDSTEVAGPWPGNVGLYSGALVNTTTFNVLAIHQETGCEQQMSQKVTVNVESSGIMAIVHPNPANGEFTVEVPNNADTYYLNVTDFSGKVLRQEILESDGMASTRLLDMRPLQDGIYYLSIRGSKGAVTTKKLMIRN